MAKTYLQIVNEVLQVTNEVPLTTATFTTARGFQIFVQNAVNRALMDIVNESDEWPWLANTPLDPNLSLHTNQFTLTKGLPVYTFDTTSSTIDWDTFILEDLETDETFPLFAVQIEDWKRYRADDVFINRKDTDLGRPTHILRTQDHLGFQVTAVPDKAYRIRYNTWKAPAFLVNSTDTLPFPDKFYNVIILRASYYAWKFRENKEQASMSKGDYLKAVAQMKRLLMRPTFQRMRPV
jgi:hypothetical protein